MLGENVFLMKERMIKEIKEGKKIRVVENGAGGRETLMKWKIQDIPWLFTKGLASWRHLVLS